MIIGSGDSEIYKRYCSPCCCFPASPLNLGQKEGSEEDRAMSYETGNLSYNSDDDDLNTSSDSDEEK